MNVWAYTQLCFFTSVSVILTCVLLVGRVPIHKIEEYKNRTIDTE